PLPALVITFEAAAVRLAVRQEPREPAMDAHTADRPNYPLGALLNEGKTKKIYLDEGSTDRVTVVAKDDITAGDGAKRDVIPDKGRLATATTSNVLRLLKACGLPVA